MEGARDRAARGSLLTGPGKHAFDGTSPRAFSQAFSARKGSPPQRRICYQTRVRILRSRRLVHGLIGAVVFLAVAGLYWLENAGRGAQILTNSEYWFRDSILTLWGRYNPPDDRLVFLGIDDASRGLSGLDLKNLPPGSPEYHALALMTAREGDWSREIYALLCERLLTDGKARAVVFDLVFDKPGAGDDRFGEVLRQFPDKIVLGSDLVLETLGAGQQSWSWDIPATTIIPESSPDHPWVGYVKFNFWPEFKGIVRRAQYQVTLEQLLGGDPPDDGGASAPSSLALRTATKLGPVKLSQPFQPHLFRYTGPPGTFPVIPMYQVFKPDYWQMNLDNGGLFRDKVVLVGAFGSIVQDEKPTPFGIMPGPEIHLNAINALLHDEFLHELPPWIGNLLIALAVVAAWLLTVLVKRTWLRLAAFVSLAAAYLISVLLAHDHAGTIALAIPPFLAFWGRRGLFLCVRFHSREARKTPHPPHARSLCLERRRARSAR